MNKKLIAGIVALIIIVIGVGIALFQAGHGSNSNPSGVSSFILSPAQATDVIFPTLTPAGKIHYFSGSAFVEYNPASRTTNPLTSIFVLPRVIAVRWGATGAMFQANGYSGSDQLDATIVGQQLSETQSYWWYVDFATSQITLMPGQTGVGNINDVIWQNATSYLFIRNTDDGSSDQPPEALYQGSTTAAPVLLGQLDSTINLVWANQTSLVYATGSLSSATLKEVNLQALTPKTVLSGAGAGVSINPAGTVAVVTSGSTTDDGSLRVASLPNTGSNVSSQTGFNGTSAWSADGQKWAAVGLDANNKLLGYLGSGSGVPAALKISQTPGITLPEGLLVAGYDGQKIWLTDQDNNLYVASTQTYPLKSNGNLSPLKNNPYAADSSYSIIYDQGPDQYNVYINTGSFRQGVQNVLQYIRSLGADPYQLNLKWYANDMPLSS